ncbi:hypothetical protein [uncultured Clostridium sp.]|uniref:hypothetical protein n=1 Tax=uncultured Clostridium sp. TaxID=59620 RepID=UPI0028E8F70F|nr:hypothetical protein [uncultured Clostridium sp.]
MKYFNSEIHYDKIIELLCGYKGIKKEELVEILVDEECKYLLFLLLKKYNCVDIERLKKDFQIKSGNKVKNDLEKAEEKLMFNKRIRDMYFEAENILEK